MSAPERFIENYHAYLVRVTRPAVGEPWTMVVKNVVTGEEYPLPALGSLIAFLTERVPGLDGPDRASNTIVGVMRNEGPP